MLLNVLFIGNSHTYLHYMPLMVVELVNAKGGDVTLSIEQGTGEGASLERHWNTQTTRNMISAKQWDHVVLQERSGGPLEARDSFEIHARLLDGEIKKQGCHTIFYMTWANKSRPETQSTLADAYRQIARELDAKLAPVGLAWKRVYQLDPALNLHHRDGRHANPVGAYLTALVFYSVLFDTSPEGLPGTLFIKGKQRVNLDEERALFLQKIAYETVLNLELGISLR